MNKKQMLKNNMQEFIKSFCRENKLSTIASLNLMNSNLELLNSIYEELDLFKSLHKDTMQDLNELRNENRNKVLFVDVSKINVFDFANK